MKPRNWNASRFICAVLRKLGIQYIFGVPGTQTAALYEALRTSTLKSITATSEMSAAFMACGYYRASGRMAAMITIPGPGFTYALTGLAEARHDSAAVLYLVVKSDRAARHRFGLQAVNQVAMASPIVKKVFLVESPESVAENLPKAYSLALSGEPGPVMLQVSSSLLGLPVDPKLLQDLDEGLSRFTPSVASDEEIDHAYRLIQKRRKILLYVGQGVIGAVDPLRELCESLGAPLLSTTSGRGVLPEDSRWSVGFDHAMGGCDIVNDLMRQADTVLAIGCKFSHNGAGGFQLNIPRDKLIHVDASAETLNANYPARLAIVDDAGHFLTTLLEKCRCDGVQRSAWSIEQISSSRQRFIADRRCRALSLPKIRHTRPNSLPEFFEVMRELLPRDALVVTDSGLHQVAARSFFNVYTPSGLLVPSDFQSMGFGLPAAIGAKLACPDRKAVLLIGDGGIALSGLNLLTAVQMRTPLTIIVFNDTKLGLISQHQISEFGHDFGVDLINPDYALLAESIGIRYALLSGDLHDALASTFKKPGIQLLELRLDKAPSNVPSRRRAVTPFSRHRMTDFFTKLVRRSGLRSIRNWKGWRPYLD